MPTDADYNKFNAAVDQLNWDWANADRSTPHARQAADEQHKASYLALAEKFDAEHYGDSKQ